MGKVITSLQFVTQSVPSTPPSTHGNIFASASTLYFINDSGQIYDLASSSGSLRISYYTGSATTQTYIYNKLSNLKYLKVICVGAGGGGGSGRTRDNTDFNNKWTGGRGGGGGAIVWTQLISSQIPSSVTITIGTNGIGGASVTGNNIFGNPGTNGEDTSFGNLVLAKGGTSGSGGAIAPATQAQFGGVGGSISACIPAYGPFTYQGTYGGGVDGNANGGSGGGAGGSSIKQAFEPTIISSPPGVGDVQGGGAGGGAGGGWNISPLGYTFAGSGSGVYQYNGTIITGGPPGASGSGDNGSDGQNNVGLDMITHLIGYTATYGIGSGGGGGASGVSGGAGGRGGNYGAGGGGGGFCSGSGASSGAGGNGSPGLCILIEYF